METWFCLEHALLVDTGHVIIMVVTSTPHKRVHQATTRATEKAASPRTRPVDVQFKCKAIWYILALVNQMLLQLLAALINFLGNVLVGLFDHWT